MLNEARNVGLDFLDLLAKLVLELALSFVGLDVKLRVVEVS